MEKLSINQKKASILIIRQLRELDFQTACFVKQQLAQMIKEHLE